MDSRRQKQTIDISSLIENIQVAAYHIIARLQQLHVESIIGIPRICLFLVFVKRNSYIKSNMDTEDDFLILSNLTDRIIFNIIGLLLAIYALYVETRVETDPSYKPICDLDPNRISCTKVLTSRYGRGFGLLPKNSTLNIRNCTLGILFYSSQIVLGFSSDPWVQAFVFYSSVISILGTVYLACILLFVLKDLCIVCFATYFVNAAVLYLNYCRKTAA